MAFINIYFSLGSNLGDRNANILKALDLMDEAFGTHCSSLSKLIETKPVGFNGGKFLNAAVMYRVFRPTGPVQTSALEVLDKVKSIERRMGRKDGVEYDEDGRRVYHSRIIDIDILFYGSEKVDHPLLTIPHKGIIDRPFVMVPLMEIARPSLREAFPEYFLGEDIKEI